MTRRPRFKSWRMLALGVLLWLAEAGTAQAQSVRVIDDGSTIWSTSMVRVALTVVRAGTILEVRGRQDQWYLVVVPNSSQVGMILTRQVEPASAGPAPPASSVAESPTNPSGQSAVPRTTPSSPAAPGRVPQPASHRGRGIPPPFVFAGAVYQSTALHFDSAESFTVLLEKATRNTEYRVKSGLGFDVAAGAGIARRLLIGGTVSWRTRTDPANLTEQIPHPIFYNQMRSVTAATDSERQEFGVHIQVAGLALATRRLQLTVGGGPSLFRVKQALVSDVAYTETYPYDQVAFKGVSTEAPPQFGFGGHAQVEFVALVSRRVGWQTTARFSRARLNFDTADGSLKTRAGGVQVSTGIRTQF